MRKTALALALILALLVSAMTGLGLVDWAVANPYPYTNCDSSFVTVSIISPENKTYDTNSIQVNITAGAYPGVWFVWYSIDGGPFIEVATRQPLAHIFSESLTLDRLSKGSHILVAKAVAMAEYPVGTVTAYSQVNFTIAKVLEPELQIMSFEQAVEAAKMDNYSGEEMIMSWNLTRDLKGEVFVDQEGNSGFFMWLAPNGTFYEAQYPDGTALGEIGNVLGQSGFNPPNGYFFWDLFYGEGLWREEYWIFANNGTIALYVPPRGGGPTSTPPPFPQEIVYGTAVAELIAVVGLGLLVYLVKRKR
jgi:hypothetical protein